MRSSRELERFWAVVPAGGPGARLWPVSRARSPKFLHDLTGGGRTLIQATVDRLRGLAEDRVLVVTGTDHVAAVREQLPELAEDRVLAEPFPRDSMAAIGLAAAVLERRDPEAIIGSFAADHAITDVAGFHDAVVAAVSVAARGEHLVTIGIEPSHPATGFGYVQQGPPLDGASRAYRVRQFVEKPDAQRATSYVATGEFRWNSGMFVVQARTLLDLLARWHPRLAAGLREIAAQPHRIDRLWGDLEKVAIDVAVAEPAADEGLVVMVPGDFDWDDVGDFRALSELLARPGEPVTVVGDGASVRTVDSGGLVVSESDRVVAVVGLDDVVVVDTDDALLVTSRARAQDVKLVVEALRAEGRADVL